MKSFTLSQLVWLLPLTFLIHQLEEYYGNFPSWFSDLMDAQLSNQDFIVINGAGLLLVTVFSIAYTLGSRNNIILTAIATLLFVNGIVHTFLSIYTLSYSPGTISGIILFLPLGIIIFRKVFPQLTEAQKFAAISSGILTLFFVNMIARNI